MIIRLATLEDVPSIVAIASQWHPFTEEAEKQRFATLRETLNKNGNVIFVAQRKFTKEIVGWFNVRYYKDWFMLRMSVHVEHINIREDWRSKGIGSQIMQAIINHFDGKEDGMYVIFYYSEGGWETFFNKNELQTTNQHFYVKLTIKKPRNQHDTE